MSWNHHEGDTTDFFVILSHSCYGLNTRFVKLRVAHAPGMPGMFPRQTRLQRKPLVSDPGIHHVMWDTHVPWCMSGSLTRGENVSGILSACATPTFMYLVRGSWGLGGNIYPLVLVPVLSLRPPKTTWYTTLSTIPIIDRPTFLELSFEWCYSYLPLNKSFDEWRNYHQWQIIAWPPRQLYFMYMNFNSRSRYLL